MTDLHNGGDIGKNNPTPLDPIKKLHKCKHGVYGLCTLCAYKNTGRRKSTDTFIESDVVDFMSASINKQLKELS